MKKRYTDEQIIAFFKQAEAGTQIKELCRKHGFIDASFYLWRRRSCRVREGVSDTQKAPKSQPLARTRTG